MKIVVTGGRYFDNAEAVDIALGAVHHKHGISLLIHGGARGADTLCAQWASRKGVPVFHIAAEWNKYGNAAGPIRNQRMIDEGAPDACVAFRGGDGTADMKRRVLQAGIPLWDTATIRAQPPQP